MVSIFQEPECETMGGTCETKEECHKTMGSMVVEGNIFWFSENFWGLKTKE